jgi:xanthine/CO dehydrogenase XdhC/CoxF family maturation factor
LARKQFSEFEIAQLTAPIGKHVHAGNLPMEIAVAAVADLMMRNTRPVYGALECSIEFRNA